MTRDASSPAIVVGSMLGLVLGLVLVAVGAPWWAPLQWMFTGGWIGLLVCAVLLRPPADP